MEHRVRRQLDRMVDELRAKGCIRSEHVADAFGSVPRHLFLPGVPTTRAYTAEKAIPTHFDENGIPVSSSSAPNIMAVMLEQLSVARARDTTPRSSPTSSVTRARSSLSTSMRRSPVRLRCTSTQPRSAPSRYAWATAG